jgi:glycosyltransferase involved in cell wall biosynthesis
VIAGRADSDTIAAAARPPLAGHVVCRGYVPADERESLYKGAMALILPSFDEGFGIPALEAMAAGVPVVVSNRAALPEVVGDAGLYIDPEDTESITAALIRLIGDFELRAACARRGLERAKQFTWAQTARSVRGAYEDALVARRQRAPVLAGAQSNVHSRNAHRH